MTYHMRDMKDRHGELWHHLSNEELVWICLASASAGLLIGLAIGIWGGMQQ